ncbi:Ubiquitin-conjugating enzyme E2 [Giardia muris]|uniref:Ubiquitin-conjugating enzyme E2 n=1 Tax=Giardia muris TaxID=5742 RepID=A0A4Z1SMW2_GIAMU|nr:Ubiquitin-conjugating enzyme E2 [Giardia muris]|eukprot:TNJ27054.1 Ubiquitin-conjugating enzyme E2 [Giardia muris]
MSDVEIRRSWRLCRELRLLAEARSSHLRFLLPEDGHLNTIRLILTPAAGPYRARPVTFQVSLPSDWPFMPPILSAITSVFHPNIARGRVCLNLTRDDYDRGLTLTAIAHALLLILATPTPDDPLDPEAAEAVRNGTWEAEVNSRLTE